MSPVSVEDCRKNSIRITGYNDPNYKKLHYGDYSNWKFMDRVMLRVWPASVGLGKDMEVHNWLDYLLWKVFPADEADFKYAF